MSSRRRNGCPVSVPFHVLSSLMSATVFGSGGVCFLLALESVDVAVLKVDSLSTTSLVVLSHSLSRSLFNSSVNMQGMVFTCTSF